MRAWGEDDARCPWMIERFLCGTGAARKGRRCQESIGGGNVGESRVLGVGTSPRQLGAELPIVFRGSKDDSYASFSHKHAEPSEQ